MSNRDRKTGCPPVRHRFHWSTPTRCPQDPHRRSVRDATTQVSTLVRAEVELAKAEITRDVKKGLTGSVFFILVLGGVGLLDLLHVLLPR